jgi:hypothetical protein
MPPIICVNLRNLRIDEKIELRVSEGGEVFLVAFGAEDG